MEISWEMPIYMVVVIWWLGGAKVSQRANKSFQITGWTGKMWENDDYQAVDGMGKPILFPCPRTYM